MIAPPIISQKRNNKLLYGCLLLALVPLLLVAIGFTTITIKNARQARIEKDLAAAKAAAIVRILDNLKKQYPGLVFAPYSDFIAFNVNIGKCNVNSVSFIRSMNSIKVVTRVQGVYTEPQAPDIYITLYEENGYPIFRGHCVDFFSANLGIGCVENVDDLMAVGMQQPISFVSIDPFESVVIINGKLVQMRNTK